MGISRIPLPSVVQDTKLQQDIVLLNAANLELSDHIMIHASAQSIKNAHLDIALPLEVMLILANHNVVNFKDSVLIMMDVSVHLIPNVDLATAPVTNVTLTVQLIIHQVNSQTPVTVQLTQNVSQLNVSATNVHQLALLLNHLVHGLMDVLVLTELKSVCQVSALEVFVYQTVHLRDTAITTTLVSVQAAKNVPLMTVLAIIVYLLATLLSLLVTTTIDVNAPMDGNVDQAFVVTTFVLQTVPLLVVFLDSIVMDATVQSTKNVHLRYAAITHAHQTVLLSSLMESILTAVNALLKVNVYQATALMAFVHHLALLTLHL